MGKQLVLFLVSFLFPSWSEGCHFAQLKTTGQSLTYYSRTFTFFLSKALCLTAWEELRFTLGKSRMSKVNAYFLVHSNLFCNS